jgi:hypothetical protein
MTGTPRLPARLPAHQNETPTEALMDPRTPLTENEDALDQDIVDLEVDDLPEGGELSQQIEQELREEEAETDDDPYQESDEALPDDDEEKVLDRNPSLEGGAFDEV